MKVRLLIKHAGEPQWRVPSVTAYQNEDELQMLLSRSPEVLPGEGDERPLVLAREFPVAFGFVDLVGISASGAITVIECKLRANAEIRRTVVGQLLAYAASLWGLSFEEFDDRWRKTGRPSLLDDLATAVAAQGLDLDAESIRSAVEDNLLRGRFRLIVAVDDITPELQRIIEYLSEHTLTDVGVIAVELGYISDGDVQVLVPQAYGVEMARQKAAASGERRQWDEPSFFAALRADPGEWAESIARRLLDWADRLGMEVWYGSGAKQATYMIGLRDAAGLRRSVFACYAPGGVLLSFEGLKTLPPFDDPAARRDLLARINAIEGVAIPERMADTWPTVRWEALRPPQAQERFLAAYEWVVARIRERAVSGTST